MVSKAQHKELHSTFTCSLYGKSDREP